MTATDQKIISSVNVEQRKELGIKPGDTVRVWQKIEEKDGGIRLQQFEGLVIARKHGTEPSATFTVRRSIDGVGVEKIFPLYSPKIDKIEIIKRAQMRRSKLYHIRDKAARQIKRQMRKMVQVDISTESDMEAKERAEQEAESSEDETESRPEGVGKESQDKAAEDGESDEEAEEPEGDDVPTSSDNESVGEDVTDEESTEQAPDEDEDQAPGAEDEEQNATEETEEEKE